MKQSTFVWPKRYNVIGLCFCAAFICYIDRVNISVASIAMQEEFGWNNTLKGFVLSSFFVGYLTMQVVAGFLSNRFGGKLVLLVAVVWWSIFTMLAPIAASFSFGLLIASRILLGVGESATFPASYSLYKHWVPPHERSRAVAFLLGGIPFGTLFALLTTGWIVEHYGWQSVFYLFGMVGFVWAFFWYRMSSDDPATHPGITESELTLLAEANTDNSEKVPVPWRLLFSKPAVWALIINHFCSNWTFYMLLSWLPSYFSDVQNLSITSVGLYVSVPWITMFIVTNIGGWGADKLISKGVSTTIVRKSFQAVGLIGSAGFLLLVRDVDTPFSAMLMLCGSLAFIALSWSGFAPNHFDIAPRYSDVLIGITNTIGTLPGIIGVLITGWLIDVTGTYDAAFLLAAAVNVIGAIIWLLFARGQKVID